MTYTDKMKMAFHSIRAPHNFKLTIIDNEHFITVRAKEEDFMRLTLDEKYKAIEYMVKVKNALEDNGAIVMLVREGGKEE